MEALRRCHPSDARTRLSSSRVRTGGLLPARVRRGHPHPAGRPPGALQCPAVMKTSARTVTGFPPAAPPRSNIPSENEPKSSTVLRRSVTNSSTMSINRRAFAPEAATYGSCSNASTGVASPREKRNARYANIRSKSQRWTSTSFNDHPPDAGAVDANSSDSSASLPTSSRCVINCASGSLLACRYTPVVGETPRCRPILTRQLSSVSCPSGFHGNRLIDSRPHPLKILPNAARTDTRNPRLPPGSEMARRPLHP